ncbi:MAG TPA: hypothetical protein VKR53_00250 [Puia sp.]|nr:hypothetical protein [Puia sp.]
MLRNKNSIFFISASLFTAIAFTQHPDFNKIDSLRKILPTKHGMDRINYLNAIGIEYWWPSMSRADTITQLANLAYKESRTIDYIPGEATSIMLLGVAEIFRLYFNNAENYLRRSLSVFEELHDDFGEGWCSRCDNLVPTA